MVENSKNVGFENCEIGRRVGCDGEYGTICYVGALEGMSGVWVGIDWDCHLRGRHDGTYRGKKYFETRYFNLFPLIQNLFNIIYKFICKMFYLFNVQTSNFRIIRSTGKN